MDGKYEIGIKISREDARKVLARLATDTDFRERLEENPVDELAELGITIPRDLLPDEVTLPPMREIAHLLYAGDSVLDETASPFGLLIIFVFGAMPVTMGRSPAGDGAV
jgi:hypothetical protein